MFLQFGSQNNLKLKQLLFYFTSEIDMPPVLFFFFLPAIAVAAFKCDGKYFVCNHTDTHFAIDSVQLQSASQSYWKAGDTVTASFSVSSMELCELLIAKIQKC